MSDLTAQLDHFMEDALKEKVFPGASVLFAQDSEIIINKAYGVISQDDQNPVTKEHYYDLASISKPVVTATVLLHLIGEGKLFLQQRLVEFFPSFGRTSTKRLTLMDLVTHRSGFAPTLPLFEPDFSPDIALKKLLEISPIATPGTKVIYSCLNYLLLSQVIKKVTGTSVQEFFSENFLNPLQLEELSFNPLDEKSIPTSYCTHRKRLLQGQVHDENSGVFGADGGNSGLFGTALGLYKFVSKLFDTQADAGPELLTPHLRKILLQNHNPETLLPRAIGWDIRNDIGYQSAGDLMPKGSFGHLGFTGTSCWFHPKKGLIVILLTNRINFGHDATQEKIRQFRPKFHNLLLSHL
ncbi:MAG: serine hydrolase domain-containing protein [SAR324 cluster bacterium]|nr:serine hydrolase domain-containing protein [SAR324 cluster bacterium]